MVKRCFKCRKEKLRSEFYRHGQMADGLLGKCKTCTRHDVAKNRAANIDRVRQYDRERSTTPERREKVLAYARDHPKVVNAHKAVHRAVKNGDLPRPDACSRCGRSCKPVGHHEDYDLPLVVNWMCRRCHREIHIELESCQSTPKN